MSLGPFDLNGHQFLMLYGILLVAVIAICFFLPHWIRPAGRSQKVTDVDQLAVLAGGSTRLTESAVSRLMASGGLTMVGKSDFGVVERGAAATPVENAVIALPSPMTWQQIDRVVASRVGLVRQRLTALGLLISDDEIRRIRMMQTLPFVLLFMFGATKLGIGLVRDKPIGFLIALLIGTALFALIRYFSVDRRTQAAIKAIKDAKAVSSRLARAPTAPEMGLAVALFGTAVLAGSEFEQLHKLRAAAGGDSGTSSSDSGGSSDGGSGCGGGGCGGCGS